MRILSSELDKKHHLINALNIKRVNGQRLCQYRFRHILFQKYLYGRLDEVEKSYIHEDVGSVLEELHGTNSVLIAAQLARHFEEAGIDYKAIQYLLQAGKDAMKLSANEQAAIHFNKGLVLIEKLPETDGKRIHQELDLQIALGSALQPLKGFSSEEVARVYDRAHELCQQIGQTPQAFKVLWGIWAVRNVRAEFKKSEQISQQLIDIAKKEQESDLMLQALHATWTTDFFRGEFRLAQERCEEGLKLYGAERHQGRTYEYGNHDPAICGYQFLAWSLLLQGYADRASKQLQKTISLYEKIEHSFSRSLGLLSVVQFNHFKRALDEVLTSAEDLIDFTEEHKIAFFNAIGLCIHGWALVSKNETKEGFAELSDGLEKLKELAGTLYLPYCNVLLVEACIENGDVELAIKTLDESLRIIQDSGGHFFEAEHYRLKSKLAYSQLINQKQKTQTTLQTEVERNYLCAIEVSQRQNAKLLELRATVDLVDFWRAMGKKSEAIKMLQEVYDWFDEGFDFPDLINAKILLGMLKNDG